MLRGGEGDLRSWTIRSVLRWAERRGSMLSSVQKSAFVIYRRPGPNWHASHAVCGVTVCPSFLFGTQVVACFALGLSSRCVPGLYSTQKTEIKRSGRGTRRQAIHFCRRGALQFRCSGGAIRRCALHFSQTSKDGPRSSRCAGSTGIKYRYRSDLGYRNAAGGLLMITSTRRFCCRPVAESLPATGSLSPMPDAVSRLESMPCPARYDFTESARRSESPWL
jgi:hypothetical protein